MNENVRSIRTGISSQLFVLLCKIGFDPNIKIMYGSLHAAHGMYIQPIPDQTFGDRDERYNCLDIVSHILALFGQS